jgi:hypothetical protein
MAERKEHAGRRGKERKKERKAGAKRAAEPRGKGRTRREGEGGSRRTKVEEGSVEKVEGALTDARSSAMDNADDGRRRLRTTLSYVD